jgi:hypothetical protein
METVHALLRQSGQTVPAKTLSNTENSVQVYDVEHWPETFNSLLLHDFPSLVVSIDSSPASLSGFVVTLHWNPKVDITEYICDFVHVLVVCIFLFIVLNTCFICVRDVSLHDMEEMLEMYSRGNNSTSGTSSSLLTNQLRSVMTHSEL